MQDTSVMSSRECVTQSALAPCDHEEADTRLFLHALHCAQSGHRKVLIRSVDTDVVVLAIDKIPDISLEELWVAYGTKQHYRLLPAHAIADSLGEEKARALPFFHPFSGCNTSSSFSSIGKKTAWGTWGVYHDITHTFPELCQVAASVSEEQISQLERFVILLYDKTSECTHVNEARKVLFAKGRQIAHIAPTKAALKEHVKCTIYQARHMGPNTDS